MILIPFQASVPNYRIGVVIDAVNNLFDVRWNERDDAWFFDLLTEDEDPIVSGCKIVLGAILAQTSDDRTPRGIFIAKDTSESGEEANLDDLGIRVLVRFYTPEEFRAL